LKAKLDALAKIRSAEGYMAEVRREPETGHWLFVENHCPDLCRRASVHRSVPRGTGAVPPRARPRHQGRAPFHILAALAAARIA